MYPWHSCQSSLVFGPQGLLLITIQAYYKNSQADSGEKSSCVKGGEAFMFYTSLCLLALGSGGVKGSIAALGADQFDRTDQEWARSVASYFNYYQFSATIGSLIGVTAVVWIALNKGWHWAFFTGLVTAFVGFVVLALGKPFYMSQPLASSSIVKISQVRINSTQLKNLPTHSKTNSKETRVQDKFRHIKHCKGEVQVRSREKHIKI